MKAYLLFAVTILAYCFSVGCTRIVSYASLSQNKMGKWDVFEVTDSLSGKHVVILGIQHMGKIQYYADVRNMLDSLRDQGYVIFYENVDPYPEGVDSMTCEIALRKLRRVIGTSLTYDYTDKSDKTGKQQDHFLNSTSAWSVVETTMKRKRVEENVS